jgi:uncharacterized protein involved in oxidation of intracellular sulfur
MIKFTEVVFHNSETLIYFRMHMSLLLILYDPPYGSERSYNGLRLALALKKEDAEYQVNVFLIGDAVSCAVLGQKTPNRFYNIERMIRALVTKKVEIKLCGGCLDARGIDESAIISRTKRSNMSELAKWTLEADKVITF